MSVIETRLTIPSHAKLPSANDLGWSRTMCHEVCRHAGRFPVTLTLSVLAVVAFICPGLTVALQLDFASVASGQSWRLLTGHFTHFGGEHLFWDVLMFTVLGAACEHQHRRLFGISILVMTIGISATVLATCRDVSGYRGLSGVDTGLFVWFLVDQIRQSIAGRDRMFAAVWTAAGTLLIGKLLFEWVTGEILFVDATDFKPLVESHLAGAAFGALFAGIAHRPALWRMLKRMNKSTA